VPAAGALDTHGLDISDTVMEELLSVHAASWRAELPQIEEHYAGIGGTLPATLAEELSALDKRLAH